MAPSPDAVRLARRLRDLRESQRLTQSELARALSTDSRVAVATISSWESQSNPKLPPRNGYARTPCSSPELTTRLREYAVSMS